ncbi:MAG: hypothetical protein O3B13_00525 [Planctomycetota bacterium]|nr:hypothetical protein [Planctomycetota bacterium]
MSKNPPDFYLGTRIDGVHLNAEQLNVRSTDLNDLIGSASYTDALFHILLGRLPAADERRLFDIVLVAFHGGFGLLPPTTLVPRLVAGTGVNTAQAMAAGFLASGPYHVGAIEHGMKLYKAIADEFLAQGKENPTAADVEQFAFDAAARRLAAGEILGGYGHPLLRKDPRPTHIRRLMCEMNAQGIFIDIYDGVVRCMLESRSVVPNVDGMTGAILLHLGFQVEHGTGLFLHARSAAMLAHIIEEQTDMPYLTARRFMFMPVAMPRLFNADFKQLTRRFNGLRDSKVFQAIKSTVSSSTRKTKQKAADQEQRDLKQIAEHRRTRNSRTVDTSILTQQAENARVVARQKDFTTPPETPETMADEGLFAEDLISDCSSPELLAGAAFFLSSCLQTISDTNANAGQVRKSEALIQSALELIRQAGELSDSIPESDA